MANPEYPQSFEETKLREEITGVLSDHSDDVLITKHWANPEDPDRIMLAGRLRGHTKRKSVEVELFIGKYDENGEIAALRIDEDEYMITNEGVTDGEHPEFYLCDDELADLRFWIRETKWSNVYTRLLAARRQEGHWV